MKKLHLGCGKKIIEGWVNIDIDSSDSRVVSDDVKRLSSVEDKSVDVIYACHVLEHFGRHEIDEVLKTWHRKLVRGGVLRVAVPDFESVCRRYLEVGNIEEMLGFLNGGQRTPYDFHKVNFDYSKIRRHLEAAGFADVKRYDWKETDHSHIDDYSQSYLPHMQKDTGTLMSLNVESIKL